MLQYCRTIWKVHQQQKYHHKSANIHKTIFRQETFRQFVTKDATEDTNERISKGKRLIIFGLGNVGALVAERSTSLILPLTTSEEAEADKPYFDHVYGTIRSCNSGGGKEISGVQSIDFNNANELKRAITLCTHVLVTIPPTDPPNDSSEDEDEKFICDPVLNHPDFSLEKLLPTNTWVGYISSTAVYGNHDGDWVTEASETKCECVTRAETYLTAENEWRERCS